jgi:hypothetical protein
MCDGTVCNVIKKKVNELLPTDHEAIRNRFSQLSEVLHWIKEEFDQLDGKTGSIVYDPKSSPGKLVLKMNI